MVAPLRLLHVVPTYIPAWRYGGPIHSVHGLCAALTRRGHAVTVATTNVNGPGDSDVPLGVPVEIDGVRVHYFKSAFLRRIYFSPPLRAFLREEARRSDLIHTHSVFLWPTTAAARVARALVKPYVVSPRGMLVRDLIARRSGFAKRAWITLFENDNIRLADAIHSTSAIETEELMALGFKPRTVFEIPNGTDIPAGAPGSGRDAERERYILFLGRINWKKGLDRLLKALATCPDVVLVVGGNDEDDYLPEVRRLADALSISSRIRYAGYVEGEAKARLLRDAAALVLPSYSENFGIVLIEAMAQATPVIVTPEVGLSRFIAEHRCGIVAGGAPEELGAAIRSLWSDPVLRESLGANGRSAAEEHFSWDGIAAQFEAHYRSLLKR
jgi:glycosyltransferase involved in cell wall biosynthesis